MAHSLHVGKLCQLHLALCYQLCHIAHASLVSYLLHPFASLCYIAIRVVVTQEIRQALCCLNALCVFCHPVLKLMWHILNHASRCKLVLRAIQYAPRQLLQLLIRAELWHNVAEAVGMPALKHKALGVHTCQIIANIPLWHSLLMALACFYLVTSNKRQLLPACNVGSPISHVCLRACYSHGILIAGAVHTLPWMVGSCSLAQNQFSVLVAYPPKQLIGFKQVLSHLPAQLSCIHALTQPQIQCQLQLLLALTDNAPNALAQIQPLLLTCKKGIHCLLVALEVLGKVWLLCRLLAKHCLNEPIHIIVSVVPLPCNIVPHTLVQLAVHGTQLLLCLCCYFGVVVEVEHFAIGYLNTLTQHCKLTHAL